MFAVPDESMRTKQQSNLIYFIMGVKFENDSNRNRGEMSSYHRKPSFRNYNGGASLGDIANVKPIPGCDAHEFSP